MIVEIALSNKTLEVSADRKTIEVFTGGVISGGGGGGGATNLAYTASPTNGIVTSDTGTDATIPAGSTTNASLLLPADKTKLDGVATGATANSSDATLLNRANHTGTQSAGTITGLATVATTGAYADLTGKPTIPTLTSQLTNDSGFLTTNAVTSVAGKTGVVTLAKADVGLGNVDNTSDANKPVSTATQTALNAKENTITAGTTSQYYRGDKTFQTLDKTAVGLGNVANVDTTTTANITDASNKRFITDAQQTVLGNLSGTNTGDNATNTTSNTYADGKVADAITDGVTTIAPSQNAVFDALALKQNTITNSDSITQGSTNLFLTTAERTKLTNTSGTNSGDNAVNSLYSGLASSKQDTLVSGTNIKTINGDSILGSGNLVITGGSGITNAQSIVNALIFG